MPLMLKTRNPCHRFLLFLTKLYVSTNPSSIPSSAKKVRSISASEAEWNGAHVDFSPKTWSGIRESVISLHSYIWGKKAETFAVNCSLQDLLRLGSNLSPEITHRFWQASALRPKEFLEILLDFGPDVTSRKVVFLWKLFRWASQQSSNFRHFPRSYEMMILMLIQARMLGDAESLLLSAETQGVFPGTSEIYSGIIGGYAEDSKLENSIMLYDRARDRGLVLSALCYRALLNLLIKMGNAELALRVYKDMIEYGMASNSVERFLDFVINELTKNERILEAVKILRQIKGFGIKASPSVLTAIAEGYCRKKDFEDMLSFMMEWKHVPEACVCNKIVSSVCMNMGAEEAWVVLQRMEILGFVLDATTFGILISCSCREGKLRNAFVYLSESSSRRLKPQVHAYNALISGVFKEGLHEYAKDVFDDMKQQGASLDLSTFKVLLAGYCKYRKFDEVEMVLNEMIHCGVISPSPVEDTFSKAFAILGLDRLGVKVKRDNDVGLPKAEFFDSLGNGLYLETDLEMYEMTLAGILDNAIIPDFDSSLLKELGRGDVDNALKVKDEIVQWGSNLSLSSYSELLKCLCASPFHIKEASYLLEELPDLCNQLDHEILNLLVKSLSKNGMPIRARKILDMLLRKDMMVESKTWTALIKGFCEERNISALQECLKLALSNAGLQGSRGIKAVARCLCKLGMIHEVLELSGSMIGKSPDLISSICNAVTKELCLTGFTSAGCLLMEEFLHRNLALDHEAYMNLLKGFLREEKFAETLGIIDILLEKNIGPQADVYQLLVIPLMRFNLVEKAISLKEFFLSEQFEADVLVYSTLITNLCTIGKIKEAAIQLQEMLAKRLFPDSDVLNALIRRYCKENNLMRVHEILCIMLRMHVDLSISAYRSMVHQMCGHENVNEALSLKKLIQEQVGSQLLIFYNILIFYLLHAGRSLHVKAILNEMQKKQLVPDQTTYNFLIYGCQKCKDYSNMVEIANTVIAKGHKLNNRSLRIAISSNTVIAKGHKLNNRSLRIAISYLCSHGRLNEALKLSKLMKCRGWMHGTLVQNTITGCLLSHGWLCDAELFLDQMEEQDLIPRNINYDFLIKQFCAHGRIKKAIDLLNIMLKRGSLPSEKSYSAVIHGLCVCQELDQALNFLAEMQQNNLQPSLEACDVLIRSLSVSGRTDEARRTLRSLVLFGPFPTHSMFKFVLNRYYAENNLEKASELVHEMQESGYSPDFETHWSLISNLSNCDSKDPHDGKGFLSFLLTGSGIKGF